MLRSRNFMQQITNKKLEILYLSFLITTISGLNCSSDPCMYGICLDDNNSSYSCYCIDGYTGINCEINWDDCWSNPCLNDGICNDGIASYNCTCVEGFIGLNCEQKYSECLNHPCLNNGTCHDYNGVMCQCPEGYSGEYCEIDASVCNNTICKNDGECIEGPGFSFSCECTEGWTGQFCEEDVNECFDSPCLNGGLCINLPSTYTCACLFGFTGKDCEKTIIPCETNPCKNDAICLFEDMEFVCYCVPDYHGTFCELKYDDCEANSVVCENGGTCIDGINNFTCGCLPEYNGQFCTIYIGTSTISTIDQSTVYPETSSQSMTIFYTPSTSSFPTTEADATSPETTIYLSSTITIGESKTDYMNMTMLTTEYDESVTDMTHYYSTDSNNSTVTSILTTISTDVEEPTEVTDFSPFTTIGEVLTSSNMPTVIDVVTISELTPTVASWTSLPVTSPMNTNWTMQDTVSTMKIFETTTDDGLTTESTTEYNSVEMTSVKLTTISQGDTETETMTDSNINTSASVTFDPSTFLTTMQTTSTEEFYYFSTETSKDDVTITEYSVTDKTVSYRCIEEECVDTTLCLNNYTECDCNYSDNCKKFYSTFNAAFNGKSYIRHDIPVKDDASLKIFIKLKTKSRDGILIHTFFDDERYALLYLEVGQLKFQFSCGLQTMLFGEIDSSINNGFDVNVEISFQYIIEQKTDKCSAKLLVNDTIVMSGEQILPSHESVPQHARLHLGGIPITSAQFFPQTALGFVGCMSLLKVNNKQRHFIDDSTETFQIEECNSFMCLLNPCKNFGACEEINGRIQCNCVAGHWGEFCEKSACDNNPCYLGATCITSPGTIYICVCPLGMHGLYCEEEITLSQLSFSVPSPGFSSYVAYGITSSIKNNMELKIHFIPHIMEQISLIAYMGQSGSRRDLTDYFSITYVRGYIMLTWDLGSGVRRIFTNTPLITTSRKSHTLSVGRKGREAWLHVEGIGNVTGRSTGTMTKLDVSPILYVGGHKSKYFETLPHDLPLHTGFVGCIFDIELRTENAVFPITISSPATGRGVGECHRNECSNNSCKNGAVCINHGPTYSCICMKGWEGPDCSIKTCNSSDSMCHKANTN